MVVNEFGSKKKKSDLVCLYKCHVLLFIGSGMPAYYHATSSILKLLDDVQNGFIENVGISNVDALLHFNLAPLCVRRDVAMLSVLFFFW